MRVKILYFSGCPNWQKAAERTEAVLVALGRADVVVERHDVLKSADLPPEWAGSPTVLINGRDPFRTDGDLVTARDTCRVYRTARGFEGAPGLDQLRSALSIALDKRNNRKELIADESE